MIVSFKAVMNQFIYVPYALIDIFFVSSFLFSARVGWCVPFFPVYPETQIEEPYQYTNLNTQDELLEYNADAPVWTIQEPKQYQQRPSNVRQQNERYIPSYLRLVPGGWRHIAGLETSPFQGHIPGKTYHEIGKTKIFVIIRLDLCYL